MSSDESGRQKFTTVIDLTAKAQQAAKQDRVVSSFSEPEPALPEITVALAAGKLRIFGEQFSIAYHDSKATIDYEQKRVYLNHLEQHWPQLLQLLAGELSQYLEAAIARFQGEIGAQFSTLKVRVYKSRWGSFSGKGVLAFNTLLIGAPKWVIDYVVVHELCHYQVMAHNVQFWRLVEQHYGERYQAARRYLREHGEQLMLTND